MVKARARTSPLKKNCTARDARTSSLSEGTLIGYAGAAPPSRVMGKEAVGTQYALAIDGKTFMVILSALGVKVLAWFLFRIASVVLPFLLS